MGLLDDAASAISGHTSHHGSKHHKHRHHKSRSRSRSPSGHHHHSSSHSHGIASIFGGDSHNHKHNSSRASFFSLPSGSRSSFFNFGGSRSSYYKRSSRPNFVNRAYRRLKRLLRDLVYYAKRHPVKVFMLVIMPLITGGALTAMLARFGLRLPAGLERLLGIAARAGGGGGAGLVGEAVRMASGAAAGGFGSVGASVERGREGGLQWERRVVERDGYGRGAGGWGDGLMGVAKMFI